MGVASPKHASHEVTVVHHAADVADNAVYREVDRARGKRDAPTPSVAPNDDALRRLFAVVVRGLPVSLCGFLQNIHVESLFGHPLFQSCILFFESLELLRHLRLHAAVLLSPAVIGLFSNLQLLADLGHLHALAEKNIRSTQIRNDLIHRMSFLTHLKESSPGLRPEKILSLQLDQF